MCKKKLLAVAVLTAMGAASVAQAAPMTLPSGPIYFQFNNLEQVDASLTNGISVPGGAIDVNGDATPDTPVSEGNWGGFNISSMQSGAVATPHEDISGGTPFFVDTLTHGAQVSGIFYGITTTSGTTAQGGWMDIYWDETPDITASDLNGGYSPSNRTAANAFGKFTDGTFLARLAFMPGIIAGDATTTIQSDIDVSNITGNGKSDSFADVVDINNDGVIDSADGAWAAALNGDWFYVDVNGNGVFGEAGERRDLRFSTFFNLLAAWDDPSNSNILGLRSNDPGRVYVPEPGILGLLGIGMLGMVAGLRRRVSS